MTDESSEVNRWRDLRRTLEGLPQEPSPRGHPRNWLFRAKRAADFIGHSKPHHARFLRRVNPYPKPFEHVKFRTEDGVQIASWYGPSKQANPRFGIVLVPGMWSTKDDTVHKRRTIRMWRHWDVPVMCIDMRAFGESTGIGTGGWKEALDVHGAVRELARRSGVQRVGVIAESMGGAAALNAAAHDSASGANLMTAGVLTWSAFVDARDAVHYISTPPAAGHPFRAQWEAFVQLLRYRSMGGYRSFLEYMEDAARVNGLESVEELFDLANPKWKIGMIHSPTLAVHSTDDPVVPVRHARRLERYARDHPHVQVLTTDWGGHTGFEAMDPWWFWEVISRFFGEVNGVQLPNLSKGDDRTTPLGQP